MEEHEIVVGAATRAFPGEVVNGDTWTVQWPDGSCRITLVDGLGHGPEAAEAARVAADVLMSNPDLGPEHTMLACHRALVGTRGAVGLSILVSRDGRTLTYAGVGNVEGRVAQDGAEHRLVSYRGILGAAVPTIRSFRVELGREWLLVLHSDGVSDRFELGTLVQPAGGEPAAVASKLLLDWGRQTDDATVLVARPRRTAETGESGGEADAGECNS